MVNYCVCTLFKSLFCQLFLTKLFKYCKTILFFPSFFNPFFSLVQSVLFHGGLYICFFDDKMLSIFFVLLTK